MIAKWPEPADYAKYVDEPAERAFELCRTVVSAARATRSRYRLSPSRARRGRARRCRGY